MTTTAQERAAAATDARRRHARRRRFARYAAEMAEHPKDVDRSSQIKLAEALHDGHGWIVFEDH